MLYVSASANAVRLVGGTSSREGRLEVFHDSSWGTVCDDGFTDANAKVVCYSLGFGYEAILFDISVDAHWLKPLLYYMYYRTTRRTG